MTPLPLLCEKFEAILSGTMVGLARVRQASNQIIIKLSSNHACHWDFCSGYSIIEVLLSVLGNNCVEVWMYLMIWSKKTSGMW